MSFAEIILRVGITFVSWLVIYMHIIVVLVVPYGQCPDASAWRVSMVSGLFALGAAFAIRYGHSIRGMRSAFRYFALPLLPLVPWSAWIVLPYLIGSTFGGSSVCNILLGEDSGLSAVSWQRAWAPVQLAVLAAISFHAWRTWTDKPQDRA